MGGVFLTIESSYLGLHRGFMAVESIIEKRDDGYYKITRYYTSHTGVVNVEVEEGQNVEEGDILYTITRLSLIKKKLSEITGSVKYINREINSKFCGYRTHILDLQHMLNPEEVQTLEEEKDYIFIAAPQGAQYYITPNPGMPSIVGVGDIVQKGVVLAIAMVMKKRREIIYQGERGQVARIYFLNGQQCHEGDKLFGIVPKPIKSN